MAAAGRISRMQVFLETDRLVLRQFTEDDVDLLVELDADPEVMRYINGGEPTSRAEVVDEVLPAFLGYYKRYPGYGFWARSGRPPGDSSAGFTSGPKEVASPAGPGLVTGFNGP